MYGDLNDAQVSLTQTPSYPKRKTANFLAQRSFPASPKLMVDQIDEVSSLNMSLNEYNDVD